MKIQYNTDKTISGEERQEAFFSKQISNDLERFESHITRVEVHLSDENGKKEGTKGAKDILCLLEVRLEGVKPIVASDHGNSIASAVSGATNKMKSALDTFLSRSKNH